MKNSFFDGTALQMIGWAILVALLTTVTFGFWFPWGICMMERWRVKHTVVSSTRLKFVGTGGELFWIWIFYAIAPALLICAAAGFVIFSMHPSFQQPSGEALLLLIVIALLAAVYYPFFVRVQIHKWLVKHTEFEAYPANWAPAPQTSPAEGASAAASAPVGVARGPEITTEGPMVVVLSLGTLFLGGLVAVAGLAGLFVGRMLEGGLLFALGIVLLLVCYFKQ